MALFDLFCKLALGLLFVGFGPWIRGVLVHESFVDLVARYLVGRWVVFLAICVGMVQDLLESVGVALQKDLLCISLLWFSLSGRHGGRVVVVEGKKKVQWPVGLKLEGLQPVGPLGSQATNPFKSFSFDFLKTLSKETFQPSKKR